MIRPAVALLVVLLVAAALVIAEMNPRKVSPVTTEQREFVKAFEALQAKHGNAAKRFSLADVGEDSNPTAGATAPSTIWECHAGEFGLECRQSQPL